MNSFDKLLKLDNNEEVYHYKFSYKGVLMYPFIRLHLLQGAIEDMQKTPKLYGVSPIGIMQKIKCTIKSFWYRPTKKTQSDIVFFGSDISNIRQGNAYFNRLTESFANEYISRTILIESSDKMDYKRPRTYPKVFTKDFVNIVAKIKSTFGSVTSKDRDQICSFVKCLKHNFDYEFDNPDIWNTIEKTLIRYAKELPFLNDGYTKMLKNLSPKIIFLEDACYGEGKIPLIMAAKELSISIGEYQHGFISLTHPAYNYSIQLPDGYKHYMPDFFMSYGEYWTKNSRIPVNVLEVGNPYLSNTASLCGQHVKKEQILYLSSTVDPERCVQEVIWLNQNLKDDGYSVVFRIHPSETFRLATVYKPVVDAGILIDTQPLYETLKDTKYLIGDVSTVLFEATLFDCTIFVIDTASNRENMDIFLFNIVPSIEKVVESIRVKNYKKTESNTLWTESWRDKYHQLINSHVL
jgi:hypothetical protein